MNKTVKSFAVALAGTCTLALHAENLSVGAGATHTVSSDEAYETVALAGGTISLTAGALKCQSVTASASSTIRFDGGKLAAASWDKIWFQPSVGSTLSLESVDGKDLYLDVGYQRHYFSSGAGTVATVGAGDLVVNSWKNGNDRMYLTFNAANVSWGHSGDLRVTGQGGLKLLKGGALPSGAATGGIKLEGSTELYLESEANSCVNAIEGSVRSIGWSWLKFGHAKSGVLKNAPAIGGNCVVEKHGADTTLTLDNTAFAELDIVNGGVIASGKATTVRTLAMRANTKLDVLDTALTATEAATFNASSAITVGASGSLDVVGKADATFSLDSAGSLVKRGAGAWNIYPSQALSGRVQVSGGSLKFRYKDVQNSANDQWWRISLIKPKYNANAVGLSEIGLFANGERVNRGLSEASTDVSAMPNGTAKITTAKYSSGTVTSLFDADQTTLWGTSVPDSPKIGYDGSNPLTVVMRLPSAHVGKTITGVDISHFKYNGEWAVRFTLESSADGINWTSYGTFDNSNKGDWPSWCGGESHFAVTEVTRVIEGTGQGGVGLQPGTVVRVDAGATLDLSLVKASEREVSALEFDATIGGGTITDAVFAHEGTINLLNVSREALKTLKLPLSFVRASSVDNIKNWKVAIDGEVLPNWTFHLGADAVAFAPPGMTVVIQ